MYIPKNKYKINQTFSGEISNTDGTPYVGPIIETSLGKVFQGSSLNGFPKSLVDSRRPSRTKIERPYNDYYGPTENDYTKGSYTRYFTRDKRNGKFTEMNKDQWSVKRNLNYVEGGKIQWLLTGPIQNGSINNIPYKGTSTKNREAVESLEQRYPGILNFFSNTSEFVR